MTDIPDTTPDTTPEIPETPDRPPRRGRLPGLLQARLTRSTLLAGILTAALGLALSTQIQLTQNQGLDGLREADLITILDSVTSRQERLADEVRALQAERDELASGRAGGPEALDAARARVNALGILVGTTPAQGPGIRIAIAAPPGALGANTLLDLVQELRDAGAEAIQVGQVRVVASTSFTEPADGRVAVDGQDVGPSVTVLAIGDPHTMASALAIPGGVEESARRLGATVTVTTSPTVLVKSLHAPSKPRYARPVPGPTGGAS